MTRDRCLHPNRKLISKVRNVLEAQSPRHKNRVPDTLITPIAETITIRTDMRQFESFLRSINRTSSLLDARRLKNDVVGEIRRTRLLLGMLLDIIFCGQLTERVLNSESRKGRLD